MKKLLSLILLITAILFVSCKEEAEFVKNKGEKRVQTLSYSFNNNQEEGIVSKTANVLDSVIINGSKILATETWKEGEEYFVASLIEESDPILTRANATQNVKGSDVYTFYSYGESTIKHQTITNTNKKFEVPVDEATNYGMIFLSTVDGTGLLNTSKLTIDGAKKEMTYNATFNENLCYKKFDKSTMPSTDAIDVEFTPVFSQLGISVPVDLAGVAEVTVKKITLSSGAQEKAAVTIKYDPTKKTSNITINDYEKLGDYEVDLTTELNASKDTTILKGRYYNVIPNGKDVSVNIEMSTDGGVSLSKKIDLKDNSGTPIKFKPGKRYKLTIDNKKFVDVEIKPKEATIAIGGTQNFNLIANYVGGTSSDVTTSAIWSSDTPAVATVDKTTGLVKGVTPGTTTIRAAYMGKELTAKVTVLDYTVVVTPTTATIKSGESVNLKAKVRYSNGREEDITYNATWSSNWTSVATVYNGRVTGGNPGSTNITASYRMGTGPVRSSTAKVTVLDYTVVVTPTTANIICGESVNLKAKVRYSNGTEEDITYKATWSSNRTSVATVYNGKVTGGNVEGSATITASYRVGTAPAKSGTATITTKLKLSIVVEPGSLSFAKGLSKTLTAKAVYKNASGTIVSQSVITPSWSSSSSSVASVNSSGSVYGAGKGSATIYASYKGERGSASVTVTAPEFDPSRGILIFDTQGTWSMKVGGYKTLRAYAYLTDGSEATSGFTWILNGGASGSSRTNIITMKATRAGSCIVSCRLGGKMSIATVTIYP